MNFQIELEFVECFSEFGEVSLAAAPENIDGLTVDVFEDEFIPDGSSVPVSTGLKQVHIAGSPESLLALGKFLIAISQTSPPRDFVTHIEPVRGALGNNTVHLVVHHAAVSGFERTIRIGDHSDESE